MGTDRELLMRAFAAFASLGYEGTSLRELAKQLGVSHNLLNQRFGSKRQLWERAVETQFDEASAPVLAVFDRGDLAPADRLALLIRRYCDSAAAVPGINMLVTIESARESWRLDHLVQHFIEPFHSRLAPLLGELRSPEREGVSSLAFMSLLVSGAGNYFSAKALTARLLAAGDGDAHAMRECFVDALLKLARE